MKITGYSFGNIKINGDTYTSDVIIYPDHVYSTWWRKEGHLLQIEDITDIINAGVPAVIIGTGFYGAMKVPGKTLDYFKSHDIEAHIENTGKAVALYNKISVKQPVIAALHLTC